ncbi:MAG: nucleotidyltransferase family protein [Phascolarctobacterium sp.]|nr:nucleotidyltransferase family protein [Phascolarctobacterium sp.]
MQQVVGVIAEYNPFHNGHLYHLKETQKTGLPVIAVMSGTIMQCGEPSFWNKWLRARIATMNGIDLILELPAAFSLRSAEFFAQGSVAILQATGCVKYLACGTENPDYDFQALARITISSDFKRQLQLNLRTGLTYAAAYSSAIEQLSDKKIYLNMPNDILTLEYCKALENTSISPIFIQRQQAKYNEANICGPIASATAIRAAFREQRIIKIPTVVPSIVWQELSKYHEAAAGYNEQLLWQLIKYRLAMLSSAEIANSCQCSEGLENLIKDAASCSSLSEALQCCTKKRYPAARIRRLFLQLLLQKSRRYFDQKAPAYFRVLAFSSTGRQILKDIKTQNELPIITKLGNNPYSMQSASFKEQLELDIDSSNLAALLRIPPQTYGSDFLISPYYYDTSAS